MRSVTAALGPAAPRCGSRPSGCPRPLAVAAPSRRRLPAVARDVATRASPSDDGSSSSGLPPSPSAPSRSPPERPLSSTEAGLTGSADAASAGADLGRIAAAVEALAAAAGPAALPAASDITDLATLLHASVTASAAAAEQQAAALGRLERQAKERAAAAAGQAKLLKELQAQCKLEDQRAQREARAARLRAALAVQCSANPSGLDPHMEEDWKFQDLNRGLLVKRILTEALQGRPSVVDANSDLDESDWEHTCDAQRLAEELRLHLERLTGLRVKAVEDWNVPAEEEEEEEEEGEGEEDDDDDDYYCHFTYTFHLD